MYNHRKGVIKMRKITNTEKDEFLSAVSQELFGKNFKKLSKKQIGTLILNLGIRRRSSEPSEHSMYDEMIAHAKKIRNRMI